MRRFFLFLKDHHGAAAVEFSLVAFALIMTIVFVMVVGLILYLNQALQYATNKAARQIMVGAVQKANLSQSAFITTDLCPYLPSAMACGDVIVNVQTVSVGAQPGGYYAFVKADQSGLIIPPLSNGATSYVPGTQGSYVYLQVIYPFTALPNFFAAMLSGGATYKGSPAYLAMATMAFRNEQY